ncbi:MAG: glycosyltransferase family 2 protein [Ignavibacteria bacterium]|nr:glycosyltransferase family 2 protein [Ignavibacteria bacterium]
MELSIVIVNYNTHEYLEECLYSMLRYLRNINFEIIVVDNNSTDRGIEKLKEKFVNVKFFFLSENRGFGAGCNYAAGKSSGKYLLLVNPDIEFTNDPVSALIRFMENNKTAGACSGLLLDEESKPAYNFNDFPDCSWELKNAYGVGVEGTISQLLSNPNITGPEKKILLKLTGFMALFF